MLLSGIAPGHDQVLATLGVADELRRDGLVFPDTPAAIRPRPGRRAARPRGGRPLARQGAEAGEDFSRSSADSTAYAGSIAAVGVGLDRLPLGPVG